MLELKEKISFNRSDLDENGNVKASILWGMGMMG